LVWQLRFREPRCSAFCRPTSGARFINAWQPMLVEHLGKIDPLSVETLEDRITKAAENIRGLAALRAAWKG